jgi:hypothetical protein
MSWLHHIQTGVVQLKNFLYGAMQGRQLTSENCRWQVGYIVGDVDQSRRDVNAKQFGH